MVLRGDGAVVAWGRSSEGQTSVPNNLANVVGIAAGGNTTHALTRVQYAAPPTITGFTPSGATPGQTITVTGTAFERVVAVRAGGAIARWVVTSPTSITLTVPEHVQPGPIEVVTMSGAAVSDDDL